MSKVKSILDGSRPPGVYRFATRASARVVRSQLGEEGWRVFYLDGVGQGITDKASFFAACAEVMEFPDYFGKNWDAFEECLTDLSWAKADGYVVLFDKAGPFEAISPQDWRTAMDIFGQAVKSWHEAGKSMYVLLRDVKTVTQTL